MPITIEQNKRIYVLTISNKGLRVDFEDEEILRHWDVEPTPDRDQPDTPPIPDQEGEDEPPENEEETPPATGTRVANRAELLNVLATTNGGSYLLDPGNYGSIRIAGKDYSSPVNLRPNNHAHMPTFDGFIIEDSSNVFVDGMFMNYDYNPGDNVWHWPFSAIDSHNFAFRGCHFLGDKNHVGLPTGRALIIRRCHHFNVIQNVVERWDRGFIWDDISFAAVLENQLFDLTSDAMEIALITDSNLSHNRMHDFDRNRGAGVHPDMMMIWSHSPTHPLARIKANFNTFEIGNGAWTQSLTFFSNKSGLPHEDLEAFGNTIHNAHLHGITMGKTVGGKVNNNTLTAVAGMNAPVEIPQINLDGGSTNMQVHNNKTPKTIVTQSGWYVAGNVVG